ncbi:bifunctional diguanylate cyclase/phosphodiesterase [Pokkaliibacter sp. MBI-7]|uniref:putative bifunctional diguanylate cyclase/phosphodiesterase n=1 Tax=Pokkaliibacter sp. MBI-7 TaxID=3040600 RepID=UPI002449474A|nr:bifunctional diguanylate cyclase/phosphodiesterase [Pokkaliibacter sp. MBI-7]MDH2431787.1 bifunctional diguanylate cyclase/phosphodiesterase [Pokkaliibacter sp. MBI-7]
MITTSRLKDALPASCCNLVLSLADHDHVHWAELEKKCPVIRKVLRHQATHDPQSGLPNLDLLMERADAAKAQATPFSLIFLVINGITEIGEHHGIAAALHTINAISGRIQEAVQGHGFAARIQGELFAAVIHQEEPEAVAHALWLSLTRPIPWQMAELHLVVAAGLVSSDDIPGSTEELVRAGYAAAKDGLANNHYGGVNLYSSTLGERLERQYLIASRLSAVMSNGGLSLALQAKVNASDGCLLGAEVLVRWQDLLLGTVPPSEFIPLAERNGTITDISVWVLHNALAIAAQWAPAGLELSIAVNLSAVDLHHPLLIACVRDALSASAFPPSRLIIELTESAVAEDPDLAIRQLLQLKAMGIALSLDDFGTGYSSLSYLRRLPIDTLKIDRSFVADTPHDADAVAIVRSIVVLAQTLGMQTVAEGVETTEQALFLRGLGVDALQGYLFSRPIAPDQFMTMAQGCNSRFRKLLSLQSPGSARPFPQGKT